MNSHNNQFQTDWNNLYPLFSDDEKDEEVIFRLSAGSTKAENNNWIYNFLECSLEEGCKDIANAFQQNNITNWALQLFNNHYKQNEPSSPVCYAGSSELRDEFKLDIPPVNTITKEAIFHNAYAVLHHPAYRTKYALNLKREFPRIPLYDNFQQWAAWGKQLMNLHINYETAMPYPLERTDVVIEPEAGVLFDSLFEAKLKADKAAGTIEIDAVTTLSNIPNTAWDYKLGNRSALEWILDQYKEKNPSDPIIAEHFNTYRFHDYKEHVIDLLKRVCTVSVETMKIIAEMPKHHHLNYIPVIASGSEAICG